MSIREIVHIDEALCDGCGKCIPDCVEGALQLVNGKARLIREIYCDGLGACLGSCPRGAISIESRDAAAFDEAATRIHTTGIERLGEQVPFESISASGCPGITARRLDPRPAPAPESSPAASSLGHWPVQLSLLAPDAPCLQDSELLLTADCVPVAVPDFHQRFLQGRSVAIACPKLDNIEPHLKKLAAIISCGRIRSIRVLRMEVPCCSGLTRLARAALQDSGQDLPLEETIIGIEGNTVVSEPVRR